MYTVYVGTYVVAHKAEAENGHKEDSDATYTYYAINAFRAAEKIRKLLP